MTTYYSKQHEWIYIENDVGTVGITTYAKNEMGGVVYVGLPPKGKIVIAGQEIGVVESVKAASEVYSPVSGDIIEVNTALIDMVELINDDPETTGWIFKIRLTKPDELNHLIDAEAYKVYTTD